MDEYRAYRIYLAVKLHFTNESYDVFKMEGRVKAMSREKFQQTRMAKTFIRIAKNYPTEESLIKFLVANMVAGDDGGGVFVDNGSDIHKEWVRRTEAITETFRNDLNTCVDACDGNTDLLFETNGDDHPMIFKLYLQKSICIETLVLLNLQENFVKVIDEKLEDDLLWPRVSMRIKRYKPFLQYDKGRITNAYRDTFGKYQEHRHGETTVAY